MTEVWLSFLAGLAGSPHCLGMCGGIVAAIALHARDTGPGTRRLILLTYNLG
jgi:sulfite exporter TauE/SafE